MLLERTITQLDIGPLPAAEARQMAQFGYMQWIAGLPGRADYAACARQARALAAPFAETSPAVAEFCALLTASIEAPLRPLPLALPPKKRRGGSGARRSARLSF
ncbi:MAG: hypothetical protein OIF47_10185 [Marinibacterium sp.]|nr:hypothetical protein [Marinibacterium sp.]